MNPIIRQAARLEHKIYIERKKRKLKKRNATVFSSNCNGGVILHDMGCPFNSPTVNLYFEPEGFLHFLADPARYLSQAPVEIPSEEKFPVGRIDDITLYFMHYKTFDEAREAWLRRAARVDMNNAFVIMTDKNGCTYDQIRRFDALPYKHKVIFTCRPYPEFPSVYCFPEFAEAGEVGILTDWKPTKRKRRWIDDFDYVRFLNGEE